MCGVKSSVFAEVCLDAAYRDKKRLQNTLRLILPYGEGEQCELFETSDESLIRYGISSVIV